MAHELSLLKVCLKSKTWLQKLLSLMDNIGYPGISVVVPSQNTMAGNIQYGDDVF